MRRRSVLAILLALYASVFAAEDTPSQRGDAAMDAGKYANAVAAYAEAIEREPKKANHYVDRAAAHNANGDTNKAMADANEAIELDSKNSFAFDVPNGTPPNSKPFRFIAFPPRMNCLS
jgi:tetratricopeptide (TPR) repeat protein